MLIVFGSTTVQSEEIKTEKAQQQILKDLEKLDRVRNTYQTDFNKLYDRMKKANEYKKKIVDFKEQLSISKKDAILILSYLRSVTEYISQQYYNLSNIDDLDSLMQQLLHMPNELLSSLSHTLSISDEPMDNEPTDDTTKAYLASDINRAINNMICLLNKVNNTVNTNISKKKISKKEKEKLKVFVAEITKIINVLPVLLNIKAINDKYENGKFMSLL